MKRLYRVDITTIVYVMATNEAEARAKATPNYEEPEILVDEVGPQDFPDWEPDCLVYGTDKDATLGSVWPTKETS